MRVRLASSLAGLVLVAVVAHAVAHAAPRVPAAAKLDPGVTRTLATGRIGALARGPFVPGRARVLVELASPATPAGLRALEDAGVTLGRAGGRVLFYGRFVPATVTAQSVARLVAMPEVVRISLSAARGPLPLDRSAQLLRLPEVRGARPDLGGLYGKGVLVADIDTMVDPFHPTFFHGDGGYFDWLDVDGDGAFTAGKDAIDLDRNGKADPGETAQLVRATPVDTYDTVVAARATSFDPGFDWLYLDANGNGARDYGKALGFDDATPALGEPLFVPDDVDQDGKLDPGERVVRLGTSKLRKIFVHIEYPESMSAEYERGVNLAEAQVDFSGGRTYGFPDALHGTAVASIIAGDVPLVGRRWVGLAPEAELVVAWDVAGELPLDGVAWALAEKPDVMLHEMAPWTGLALDGSDALSAIIDDSTSADGVIHTCPTGDQGSARKHARATPPAGGTGTMKLEVPPHTAFSMERIGYFQVSVHVRGGQPASLAFVDPGGTSHDLLTTATLTTTDGAKVSSTTQTTSRGTFLTDTYVFGLSTSVKPDLGAWSLVVVAPPGQNLTVDAYVSDDQSSWALGVAWDRGVATDAATLGVPSTADHCIAVNAQPAHLETASEPWFRFFYEAYDLPDGYADRDLAIRAYSPRGPRIDGVIKPDVTAPDNPWAAAEHETASRSPYASFRPFGGTSGASPHASGVAALLAQTGVRGDAARDAMRAGAVADAITGAVPNGDYGFGRLDAAGALGMKSTSTAFTVTLTTDPETPTTGSDVRLVATVSGDGAKEGLQAEWDDGYDGSWDAPYAAELTRTVTASMPSSVPYKVRVRSAGGRVAEAILWVQFAEPSGCSCDLAARGAPSPLAASGLVLLLLLARRYRTRARARASASPTILSCSLGSAQRALPSGGS